MRGLPRPVKSSLQKAHDSALLAVEVYNKPAVTFKSGGYIVLMVIAWTALFHSVFFRRKSKPYYKKPNGRFERVDDDFKHWELDECLRQYFGSDTGNPVRKNLEFFIPLRNKIEHRSMPELDSTIFGECQALLLNFDELVEKEFGSKHCLRECLSFSLQMFPDPRNLIEAVKRNPATKPVIDFIQQFRSTISPEVTASGKFAFKAFLIQVANHKSEHALPIQFVNYDKLSDEDKRHLDGVGAMVKLKNVPVANLDLIKAGEVVRRVQAGLGNPKVDRGGRAVNRFNMGTHTRCWQHYKVRPPSGAVDPHATDYRYCVYDKMHNDYGFTQAWVAFLTERLSKESEWESLFPGGTKKPDVPTGAPAT